MKKFLESSSCRPNISMALVYKRFNDGRVSILQRCVILRGPPCMIFTLNILVCRGHHHFGTHWAPRLLTDEKKERRVSTARAFLRKWKAGGDAFLDRIITSDETWLHYYDPETKQQVRCMEKFGLTTPQKGQEGKIDRQRNVHHVHGQMGNATYPCCS